MASISKAKSIEKVSISANPGVGVFPPRKEPFVGGTTGIHPKRPFLKGLCFANGLLGRSPVSGLLGRGVPPPKNGPASAVGPPWAPLASPREGVFAHPVGLS